MDHGHYRSEEMYISVEQMENPSFGAPDVQSTHFKSPAASMRSISIKDCNEMITPTWSTEYNRTEISIKDAIVEEGVEIVFIEGCELLLFDVHHYGSPVNQLKAEDQPDLTELLLCINPVILDHVWTIVHVKAIRLSRLSNTFTVIVYTYHSFPSAMKAVLNYARRTSRNASYSLIILVSRM